MNLGTERRRTLVSLERKAVSSKTQGEVNKVTHLMPYIPTNREPPHLHGVLDFHPPSRRPKAVKIRSLLLYGESSHVW